LNPRAAKVSREYEAQQGKKKHRRSPSFADNGSEGADFQTEQSKRLVKAMVGSYAKDVSGGSSAK
jgi:hypothetical protein